MIDKIKNRLRIFLKALVSIFSKGAKDKIEEELGGGLVGIGEKDTDWIMGVDGYRAMKLKLRDKEDLNRPIIYEYDQGALYETRNWCTIYSAVTEVSWLMDYEFSTDEILSIGRQMIKNGKLDPNYGAYLSDAVDIVRVWWNVKFPENRIESYRIDYTDEGLLVVLDKYIPRPTQFGYRTSGALRKHTRYAPYIATEKNYPKVGGHAVTRWKGEIVDNYSREGKVNRYRFTHLQDLIKNGVVFKHGYMFLVAKD